MAGCGHFRYWPACLALADDGSRLGAFADGTSFGYVRLLVRGLEHHDRADIERIRGAARVYSEGLGQKAWIARCLELVDSMCGRIVTVDTHTSGFTSAFVPSLAEGVSAGAACVRLLQGRYIGCQYVPLQNVKRVASSSHSFFL